MKVNEVDVVLIPSLPELMALPAGGGDVPIYNGADNILYRIKAALLGGGSETAVRWIIDEIYAKDRIVEFGLKLWLSKENANEGNTPVEGDWWTEVSKSTANGFGYWAPGVFTVDPTMVLRSGGLFYIDNQVVTFPFNSTDFEAEYAQNKWVQVAGSGSGGTVTYYENIFFEVSSPDKAYITRGFNWKIASTTEYGGTSTIKTSSGTAYTIGATVTAGDYLTVTNTTINARFVAIIQPA